MSKITMPAPVAKVHVGNPVRYEHIDAWSLNVGTHDLITTSQAEAYANNRMQKLGKAAKDLADWAEYEVGACPVLTPGLSEIRALLSKLQRGR